MWLNHLIPIRFLLNFFNFRIRSSVIEQRLAIFDTIFLTFNVLFISLNNILSLFETVLVANDCKKSANPGESNVDPSPVHLCNLAIKCWHRHNGKSNARIKWWLWPVTPWIWQSHRHHVATANNHKWNSWVIWELVFFLGLGQVDKNK